MLKKGSRLGKYRIERKLAEGGFARVYRAFDTIEGIRVALKVAKDRNLAGRSLEDFRKEARLTAKLAHENILPIKDATILDGHFVIAYPLGLCSLHERMKKRIALRTILDFAEQLCAGLACAHEKKIIHCDIKPENLILFPGSRLRIADFGIARFALRTIPGSGSGTLGYMAPEQAMGKPCFQSDVFSAALVLYRLLSGRLPEWPFEWPFPGHERVQKKVGREFVDFLARCLRVDPRKRFKNAISMYAALKILRNNGRRRTRRNGAQRNGSSNGKDWRQIRIRQFLRMHGREFGGWAPCKRCKAPVGEFMEACPWCGRSAPRFTGETSFPIVCPRCARGLKRDWPYCPWCYGYGFEVQGPPRRDRRYTARCRNPSCGGKGWMPFMRYCPWCRRKTRRSWRIAGESSTCRRCGWGVCREFWSYCPWCAAKLDEGP